VLLDRYAHWSIFIFQYLYGTRLVAAVLFGCSSLAFVRFALLQVFNCLIWSLAIYTAGHLLGMAGLAIVRTFGVAGLLLVLILAALLGGWAWLRYNQHHGRKHPNDHDDQRS